MLIGPVKKGWSLCLSVSGKEGWALYLSKLVKEVWPLCYQILQRRLPLYLLVRFGLCSTRSYDEGIASVPVFLIEEGMIFVTVTLRKGGVSPIPQY